MNDIDIALLKASDKGRRYAKVWDEYVGPFFKQKEEDLFESFKAISCHEAESLMLCKMQCIALDALKTEFEIHMDNGKIADKELADSESAKVNK